MFPMRLVLVAVILGHISLVFPQKPALPVPQSVTAANHTENIPVLSSVIKGIFINEIFGVLAYSASIPINFQLELPLLPEEIDINHACHSDEFICDLVYKTRNITNVLLNDLIKDHPYLNNRLNSTARTTRALDFMGDFYQFLYGQATMKDVAKLQVSINYINNRQHELEDNIYENHRYLVEAVQNITSYHEKINDVFKDRFEIIRNAILESKQTTTANEAGLTEAISLSLQNQYYQSLTTSMDQTASDCRNQIIPRSLLTMSVLQERFGKLKASLFSHGYEVAGEIEVLFKQQIVDCFYSPQKLQVTLHVPIKKLDHKYQVYELIRIPFQSGKLQCRLMGTTDYLVKVNQQLVPISTRMSRSCKVEDMRFCYVPTYINDQDLTECAYAVFDANPEQIAKSCLFECITSSTQRINQVSPGMLAITNLQSVTFTCKKDNQPETGRNYNILQDVGAVLIRIPCHCTAQLNENGTVLVAPFPCTLANVIEQEEVIHTIPTQFSILRGLVLNNTSAKYRNVSEITDLNWTDRIPTLQLQEPAAVKFSDKYILDKLVYGTQQSSFLVYIWLIFLSIGLIIVAAYMFLPVLKSAKRYSPVGVMSSFLMCMICIPCVRADTPKIVPTFSDTIWSLLKMFEITNVLLGLVGGIVGLIMLFLVIKIFSFVRSTYRMTKNLCMETGMVNVR